MNIGNFFSKILYGIDWLIVLFILPIILAGLVPMKSFAPLEEAGFFFNKQIIWVGLGFAVFFVFSFIDFRFLKRTDVLVFIFLANSLILLALFIFGNISHGSKSWFDLGFVSFQPVDMMKLVLVLVLGISKTHLLLVFVAGALIFASFWFLIFAQYQKDRIADFINPLADIHGSGYNAFQSTIAVGSGDRKS